MTQRNQGPTRKALPEEVTLKELLELVIDGGTGKAASLSTTFKRENAKEHEGYYARIPGTMGGQRIVLMVQAWVQ